MYKEFNDHINHYDKDDAFTNSYWEENGFVKAYKLLEQFNSSDWDELMNDLPNKTDNWKRRLVFSMYFINNERVEKILLPMIDTENIKLFETVLFVLSENEIKVDKDLMKIIEKIRYFAPKAGTMTKDVFKMFLEKQKKIVDEKGKNH